VAPVLDPGDGSKRAEALLEELTAELKRVPVEECTRALHMRALELKRTVALWLDRSVDPGDPLRVCEELLALRRQALDYGSRLRSGWQLVHGHGKSRP
jgi:hypothetical protein